MPNIRVLLTALLVVVAILAVPAVSASPPSPDTDVVGITNGATADNTLVTETVLPDNVANYTADNAATAASNGFSEVTALRIFEGNTLAVAQSATAAAQTPGIADNSPTENADHPPGFTMTTSRSAGQPNPNKGFTEVTALRIDDGNLAATGQR